MLPEYGRKANKADVTRVKPTVSAYRKAMSSNGVTITDDTAEAIHFYQSPPQVAAPESVLASILLRDLALLPAAV